jgi:hypothetical protein
MSRVPDNVVDELIEMLERLVDDNSDSFGGGLKWMLLIEEAEALIEKAKGGKTS